MAICCAPFSKYFSWYTAVMRETNHVTRESLATKLGGETARERLADRNTLGGGADGVHGEEGGRHKSGASLTGFVRDTEKRMSPSTVWWRACGFMFV